MYFNQVEFGLRIKKLRIQKGVTQETLAEALNISFEHLSKLERGQRGCSIDLLLELGEYFNVSIDYLLTGRDYMSPTVKQRIQDAVDNLTELVCSMK